MPWSLISTSRPLANTESRGSQLGALKTMVGFARPFRPTYPGFPVESGGVVELHAAFLKRKPHTRFFLTLRNRKSGYAGANVGHPSPNEVDCATFSRVPQKINCRSLHCPTPDFLSGLVALANFMRLSLKKAAHGAIHCAVLQEIRVRSDGMTNRHLVRDLVVCRADGATMRLGFATTLTFVIPSKRLASAS
jgi:hypothetical protein